MCCRSGAPTLLTIGRSLLYSLPCVDLGFHSLLKADEPLNSYKVPLDAALLKRQNASTLLGISTAKSQARKHLEPLVSMLQFNLAV